MTYSSGQLSVLFPFIDFAPKWLLLGGPADANEAQTATSQWPGINIIAVEPNPEAVVWQLANVPCWEQSRNRIICAALADHHDLMEIQHFPGDFRHNTTHPSRKGRPMTVPAVTWDQVTLCSEVSDAILWMDIETGELPALQGAERLLASGAIRVVDVEMQDIVADQNAEIDRILTGHGFKSVHEWNASPACWDRIYVRK